MRRYQDGEVDRVGCSVETPEWHSLDFSLAVDFFCNSLGEGLFCGVRNAAAGNLTAAVQNVKI